MAHNNVVTELGQFVTLVVKYGPSLASVYLKSQLINMTKHHTTLRLMADVNPTKIHC